MTDLKIAVIVGSTRPGRNSRAVGDWVIEQAAGRDGVTYELVDLADYPMPFFDIQGSPSMGAAVPEYAAEWAAKIADADGFVFIVPEYNHGIPAVLKNAIDVLYPQWANKAAGMVSFGSAGGARAVEHLRGILSELQIAHVRTHVFFSLFNDFENFSVFRPTDAAGSTIGALFGQVEAWAGALKPLRG